jgi:N-acyl-D-aspartate/D-glutamate deacylase
LLLGLALLLPACVSRPATAPRPQLTPPQATEPAPPPKQAEPEVTWSPVDPAHTFDVVINGGRVMDPETGFDHIASVGIDGDKVTAIAKEALRGLTTIDATGRVVAPGFIDVLSYDPNPYGIWYKIADGVTTNLGMHGLAVDAATWYRQWEQTGSPANFGGAFSYNFARAQVGGWDMAYRAATPDELKQLTALAEQGLKDGWIGIDMSLEYNPGTSYDEVRAMGQVAARYGVPLFFHGRYSDMEEPGTNFDTLDEILRVARETGTSVHVEHINSTGGTFSMPESLQVLEKARADGVDVTACLYPYNFWATYLGSARFDPGWQEKFHISYGDLEIAGTGERLTPESFERYRAQNKLAAAYAIPEADMRTALKAPWTMLGSDAILEPGNNNHPRSAGTYARTLGKYVREEQVISLVAALAKMTILPAKRLEKHAPLLRTKGRLQPGSDADITIFNPETVIDRGTVKAPNQFSEGIDWVLVAGQVVKDPQGLHRDVRPGRAIRSDPAAN